MTACVEPRDRSDGSAARVRNELDAPGVIERYIPVARSLARRSGRPAEPLDDLIQVASLGSSRPLDRWDPARAFSTFAMPTIVGELAGTSGTPDGWCGPAVFYRPREGDARAISQRSRTSWPVPGARPARGFGQL